MEYVFEDQEVNHLHHWYCCGKRIRTEMTSPDEQPYFLPYCSDCGADGVFQMAENNNGEINAQMAKQLREMKERWNQSKQESKKMGGGGTTLRPGERYLTRVSRARMYSGNNGLGVILEFTCVDGDQTGEKGLRFHSFETDEKMQNCQRDLRRLGLEVDEIDVETLPAQLARLEQEAPGVRIKVEEGKNNYVNVYIDKLIDLGSDNPLPASGGRAAPARPGPAPQRPVPGLQTARTAAPAAAPARPPAAPAKTPVARVAAPQNPRPVAPRPTPVAPTATPVVEEVVEEPAEAPVSAAETFEVGMPVSFLLQGVRMTGKVHALPPDSPEKIHIRRDDTQKLVAVNIVASEVSALIPTPEPEEEVIEEEVIEEPEAVQE